MKTIDYISFKDLQADYFYNETIKETLNKCQHLISKVLASD